MNTQRRFGVISDPCERGDGSAELGPVAFSIVAGGMIVRLFTWLLVTRSVVVSVFVFVTRF